MDLKGASKLVKTLVALPSNEFETVMTFVTELRDKEEVAKPAKRKYTKKAKAVAAAPTNVTGKRRGRPPGTKNKKAAEPAVEASPEPIEPEAQTEEEQEVVN